MHRRKTRLVVALELCALLALGSFAGAQTDQHGREHEWKGTEGRYTLIDFAASWCAPCRTSLPRLEALAERFQELRVLVVSVDDRVEGRDALVESLHLKLPVIWDADYQIAEHYQPTGMPATFLIDAEGSVVHHHVGSGPEDWRGLVRTIEGLYPGRDGQHTSH